MKQLDVFYAGWDEHFRLGRLADNGRELLFEYAPEALARAIAFSPLHLPLRAGTFRAFPDFQWRLPGLIADALPDGWGMLLMDRLFRAQGVDSSRLSPLERLAFIGNRAMGALMFQPASMLDPANDTPLLQLAQAAQTLLQGQDSDVLKQMARLGGSPHGARPKVLVQFDAASGFLCSADVADVAVDAAAGVANDDGNADASQVPPGSAWLIKFQAQGEHKEVCAIEHLYAHLARACGLLVPQTHYFDLDKKLAAFGTERFDRQNGQRVLMHTLAGVLHHNFRLPSESYRTLLPGQSHQNMFTIKHLKNVAVR